MNPIIDQFGTQRWYNSDGLLHRDNDLPAVIKANGYQEWRINGALHRDNDKPAIIYPDSSQEWYINGKRHRDNDLPAVIADGHNFGILIEIMIYRQ